MGVPIYLPSANEQLALSMLNEMHKSKTNASMPVLSHADRVRGGQRGVSDEFLRAIGQFYKKFGGPPKKMDILCAWDPEQSTNICSLTQSTGLSLAETILIMGKDRNVDVSGLVGPATTFLCYSCINTSLDDILGAVNAVKIERKVGDETASETPTRYVWIDAFCASQNLMNGKYLPADEDEIEQLSETNPEGFAALREDAASILGDTSDTVKELYFYCSPLLGKWKAPQHPFLLENLEDPPVTWTRSGPAASTRARCLLELVAMLGKGCSVHVVMPTKEIDRFEALLSEDMDELAAIVTAMDVRYSQVADVYDRSYIMEEFAKLPGGLEHANDSLRWVLRDWLIGEGSAALKRMPEEEQGTSGLIDALGSLLFDHERFDEAEELLRVALKACKIKFGNDSENTRASLHNLGGFLQARGKHAEAEPFLREALDLTRSSLGDRHESTLQSINALAVLLQELDKLAEAEVLMREDLESSCATLGNTHADTIASMNNLARLYLELGKGAEAEVLFRESMVAMRISMGERHESTLAATANLGWLLQAQRKMDEAEPLILEALMGMRAVLGDDHPKTLVQTVQYGELLMKTGRKGEVKRALGDAPSIARQTLGVEHSAVKALDAMASGVDTAEANLAGLG